ncbi:unnamed protein product [Clavelina lepadiformis]|uniref:Uncharacterized protein n=1 Tax=Clavelina lepadiformis TaxID=159417 RepID=A0ABP0FK40_CLALP
MPSPSRIPRGKGLLKAKQPEENNPQVSDIAQTADGKCDSADQKKIRTQSKAALYGPKVKNTPSKVHRHQQHAALKKQGILHDRRGISEVKRSETHLQSKVNQLEAEMADVKQDLVKAQERYDQDQMKYITLQKHADALDCKLNNLQLYNDRLNEALEENNVDPVTLENLQVSGEVLSLAPQQDQEFLLPYLF